MVDRGCRPLGRYVALAALLAATPALAASGGVIRAQHGYVRAEVSFRNDFSVLRLEITRKAKVWRSSPLGTTYFGPPKLRVRDLDGDGEPEVWLDTYTGGAHCCFQSRFFHYVPAQRAYASTRQDWSHAGYRVKDLGADGRPELVSADARFAYVFTYFAASLFPVQIWHFQRGRVLDVTRSFQAQVRNDADALWRYYGKYRRTGDDVRGVLAAWMADQYLLGRDQQGWQTLEAANGRGELVGDAGWPSGSAYLRALRAFLVKTGYTH